MKSDGDPVKQAKNYFIGFVVSLVIHGILLLLIPKPLKIEEAVMETTLLEIQFLNEEQAESETTKAETPEAKTQPTPALSATPLESSVSEEVVEDEIAEEEIVQDEVVQEEPSQEVSSQEIAEEAPQNQVIQKSSKSSNTPSSSYSVVQSTQLDGKSFKPFGNKKPSYPPIARKSQIEGWVKVKVLVNEKGKVLKALVLDYQGHPSFKNATLGVARSWRFPIPTQKGQRVRTWYTQKVVFRLRD